MSVQLGSGQYRTGPTNTNRIVRFTVLADDGASDNVFVSLRGNQSFYPYLSPVATPTTNQKIAQARMDAVIRALTIYAPVVEVSIGDGGAHTSNKLTLGFETLQSNVLPNVSDIVDTLGRAGQTAKTKSGLQTLATAAVAGKSLDGGATFLFAANAALADGTVSSATTVTTLTVTAI